MIANLITAEDLMQIEKIYNKLLFRFLQGIEKVISRKEVNPFFEIKFIFDEKKNTITPYYPWLKENKKERYNRRRNRNKKRYQDLN